MYELSLLLYRISDVNTSIDGVTAHATGAAHGTVQGNAIFIPRSPGRSRNRRHPSLEDVPHTMVVGIGYNDGAAGQYGNTMTAPLPVPRLEVRRGGRRHRLPTCKLGRRPRHIENRNEQR